ncbi:MAG TPA: hypothetical protein VGB30_13805 [bacterium]|jgi:2-dehydro-3-deoxyphosphogluconate aldolase/(4S)-4-hydroxy-2-oxoglutarate aldolase
MAKAETLKGLLEGKIIGVTRERNIRKVMKIADALITGGVPAFEVTTTIPGWLELLKNVKKEFGTRAMIGLGTVRVKSDACRAIEEGGADYVVSPYGFEDLFPWDADVVCIPGATTPSEIQAAFNWGADIVKVFPVNCLGGAAYIKWLLAACPDWKLEATGGVGPEHALDILKAGAVSIGVGATLASPDLVEKEDWDGVAKSVENFMTTIREGTA